MDIDLCRNPIPFKPLTPILLKPQIPTLIIPLLSLYPLRMVIDLLFAFIDCYIPLTYYKPLSYLL
jgi:hypothetical protein